MDYPYIVINQVAQGIVSIEKGIDWFCGQDEDSQIEILIHLCYCILQAGALPSDVDEAIAISGLKPTYTPCVLLKRGQLKDQLFKVAHLPQDERKKSFTLLTSLLAVADLRRRKEKCRGECDHWWHSDLSDIKVLKNLDVDKRELSELKKLLSK